MYKESYLEEKGVEFNEDKVIQYFNFAVKKPDGFAIIAEDNDKPVGFLISDIAEYGVGHQKIARNLELYVVPEERGKMTGIQLMKKFIDWSQMNKVKEVIFDVSDKVGNFDKLSQRLNMEKIGTSYRRVL